MRRKQVSTALLVGALRVAAEQYDKDAVASDGVSRVKEQFERQARQARELADFIGDDPVIVEVQ